MEINMNRLVTLLLVTAVYLLGCSSNASLDQATRTADAESAAFTVQDPVGRLELDRSKPVPAKSEVIKAWQKRQDLIKTFRFAWTEQQTHPKGWVPNPRYPEREWLNIPGLLVDRNYTVAKTLAVDGNKMRYTFELDRKAEPDGVRIVSSQGDNKGLGEGKHYLDVSVFDGQTGTARLSSLTGDSPAVISQALTNVDAQNLDARAIMVAFRPMDPVMGHLLMNRAVTNLVRTIYKGRSTFLLEEQRDPSGWKTMVRIDPERDFLVSRYSVLFERRWVVDIDIDYVEDARWGWVPNRWRVTEMLADGSQRLVSEAKVSSYSINQPISSEELWKLTRHRRRPPGIRV
jgi:hypothetical protein